MPPVHSVSSAPRRRAALLAHALALVSLLVVPATGRPQPASAQVATPAPDAQSGVGQLRGNAARTGENAGPGPTGAPAVRWQTLVETAVDSSPAVVGGLVYVAAGGEVHALDAATGRERWRAVGEGGLSRSPAAVADGAVYLVAETAIHAFDAATGEERWRLGMVGEYESSTSAPAVAGGVVYVATDESVFAVDAALGGGLWRNPLDELPVGDDLLTAPTTVDGVVYVEQWGGAVYAVGDPEASAGAAIRVPSPARGLAA